MQDLGFLTGLTKRRFSVIFVYLYELRILYEYTNQFNANE